MPITQAMIEYAYTLARRVVDEAMPELKIACLLKNEAGMNEASAKMYIRCFVALLNDGQYRLTVNALAMEYVFSRILKDYGINRLKSALSVFDNHTEKNINPLDNLKDIADKYRQICRSA